MGDGLGNSVLERYESNIEIIEPYSDDVAL